MTTTFEPPVVANPKHKPRASVSVDNPLAEFEQNMAKLDQMAEKHNNPGKSDTERQQEIERQTREEIAVLAASDPEPIDVELPGNWAMSEWTQKILMDIAEDGPLLNFVNQMNRIAAERAGFEYAGVPSKYDEEGTTRFRRNYEVVTSVFKHGGFRLNGLGINLEHIDAMHWRDVEEIAIGCVYHWHNTVNVKKK